jgi:hypothetical protein
MGDDKRFEIIKKEGGEFTKMAWILRDKQTGVQYLFFKFGYGGGLTPLLDKDGKPIVD